MSFIRLCFLFSDMNCNKKIIVFAVDIFVFFNIMYNFILYIVV